MAAATPDVAGRSVFNARVTSRILNASVHALCPTGAGCHLVVRSSMLVVLVVSILGGTQIVWLQEFPWLPSDQHTVITGTKAEPAFIKKRNIYQSCPMSSGLTLQASQTAMAWSQGTGRMAWSYP
ncbi:hypothetical protein TNCV_1715701 [Trichonephila clavipes]|nr:hypothetical protein TNCV_1715701 [Trichonephila clavipes]